MNPATYSTIEKIYQLRGALTGDLVQLTMIVQTHFFMAQSLQPDQHETVSELVNAIWDLLSLVEPSLGCIFAPESQQAD